ncbi:hypothetical protein LUZ60_008192 [Juncus effusus]|nr:hypothetical protein LUZ60_008192 [Juncus effusus]
MSTAAVAAEWQEIADRKYLRRPEIYSMQWGRMDLSRFRLACASFGGPIAAIRDDSKIVQLLAESARRRLQIFSSSGELIASSPWDRTGGKLVGMAWTDDLELACLLEDASVHLFNSRAEPVGQVMSLGKEPSERVIMYSVFWGNGVACLTDENQVYCIPDFKNPKPCKLANPGIDESEQVFCMAANEPKAMKFGTPEVLLAVGDSVMAVGEYSAEIIGEGVGPVQKMSVSKEGRYVAMFTGDGRMVVAPMDFGRILFEFDCESALPPDQMVWSGLDSVVLHWEELHLVLVISPAGDPVRYTYDEPVQLIAECDGVRILSNSSMEFLHPVPDSTVSIFGIFEEMEPAAVLYDAYDNFERRSAKADENLRSIRSSLKEAIEGCIDAAGHEFDVSRQRTLLRAASYGRAFYNQYDRDHFKETCKTLRVLNAVREIGIPLSIGQYKLLTAPVLIGRLINANQHLLALRISEYLNLNPEVVIMHWACEKITVSPSIPDSALLEALLDKLKLCKGISYAAIAAHADSNGRRKLGAMLVEHESQPSKQVPLLLSIEEEDTALVKATESGDTDLIYLVLFHIWQKKPALDFFGTINARPLARDLFVTYARFYKHEFLKDFFLSTGQLQEVAFLLLKESRQMEKNPMASRGGSPLPGPRTRLIEQAQKLFSETKENFFESKAAEEHAKLLKVQHELEVQTKQAIFMDSSISDTIRTCIVLGNHRAALKVKTEFKVSEKRWYWLKAFALATVRDWDALEKFSKEKRPPGGYKPFVEACIDAGEKSEALKYIPKLVDPRDKSEAYSRLGMTKEAEDAGAQEKDNELFSRILGPNSSNIFDTLRDRLSFQGVY